MTKKSFGLSDSTLSALWRKAVKANCHNRCIVCGNTQNLECHHVVHVRAKILRWDWRNGVAVCNPMSNKCHAYCDTIEGREKVKYFLGSSWQYIKDRERIIHKDYLRENGLSENDWRILVKDDLLQKIGE